MTQSLNRRSFLAARVALAAAISLPRYSFAQGTGFKLSAASRTLDIDVKAAKVYGLVSASGRWGLILDPGQRFTVDLTNNLDVETIIHWHGQIPTNAQDGVPGMPAPLLKAGESRSDDFTAKTGTHWMHSHVPLQEMSLLAAPLIERSEADVKADREEVVMMLHDFSIKAPEEVLAEITGGAAGGMGAMSGMDIGNSGGTMDMSGMKGMPGMKCMSGMAGMAMDLNDYDFDAYLTNGRTLNDPEVVKVEDKGRIRLRIINGSAGTAYWIDTGDAEARLVAVDGHEVRPLAGRRFALAMGQHLNIEVDLS